MSASYNPKMTTKTHLGIATPCYGGMLCQNYVSSLLSLIASVGSQIELTFFIRGGDSLIPRTRNSIVGEFMASSCTHLLWIDADIGFAPEAIQRLLHSGHDVAAGIYPLKTLAWPTEIPAGVSVEDFKSLQTRFPFNPLPGAEADEHGFLEVLDAPTGLMMIKRDVFTRMADLYRGLKYRPDHMIGVADVDASHGFHYRFFDVMTESNGRYLSEDYAFCRRWQNIGGRVFADTHSRLTHQGLATYSGDLQACLSLQGRLTKPI